MRLCAPIVGIAFHDHILVLIGTDKAKRPRSDWLTRNFLAAALGYDANCPFGKIPQQGSRRLCQVKSHRQIIRSVNAAYEAIGRSLGAANLALQQGIKGPLDVARSQGPAIMKLRPRV